MPCGVHVYYYYITRRAVLFSSTPKSNSVSGAPVCPCLRCQELIFKHPNSQIVVFRPQEHDSCMFAFTQFVLDELPAALANTVFCYTSPTKRLGAEWPPLFLAREHDSQLAILDVDFSVLHGAFGAMDPMVRRTIGFPATKSGL